MEVGLGCEALLFQKKKPDPVPEKHDELARFLAQHGQRLLGRDGINP